MLRMQQPHTYTHTCMRILLLTDEETNFASEGYATASSTENKGYPRSAVDGEPDGDFSHRSCTHTARQLSPWWKVTLEFDVKFREVVIVNRADCCGKLQQVAYSQCCFVLSPTYPKHCHLRRRSVNNISRIGSSLNVNI